MSTLSQQATSMKVLHSNRPSMVPPIWSAPKPFREQRPNVSKGLFGGQGVGSQNKTGLKVFMRLQLWIPGQGTRSIASVRCAFEEPYLPSEALPHPSSYRSQQSSKIPVQSSKQTGVRIWRLLSACLGT